MPMSVKQSATRADDDFAWRVEALRVPLRAYCYRLLGSASEAEDATQETVIRAVAKSDRFDPERAALTTWVHRIATNICIDAMRGARRRAMPVDMGPAATDGRSVGVPLSEQYFIDPVPDSRVLTGSDPAEVVGERQSIRLALVVLLQRLPARQRAVFVLREVLSFSAAETAEIVEMSIPAVNSALQRARATLDGAGLDEHDVVDPDDARQRALLQRYVTAFETHDIAALTQILHADAVTSMPPFAWWLRGGAAIAELIASSDHCADDRLVPTVINGAPGFGQYRPDEAGVHQPFALVHLGIRGEWIMSTTVFLDAGHRFPEFGLPTTLD